MKNIKYSTLSLLLLGGLVSCASGPQVQSFPDTANPSAELERFNSDMDLAMKNQVSVLSPSNFSEALESQKDAKESVAKQKKPADTLQHIAEGRAYLGRAEATAKTTRQAIEDVVAARQAAVEANAPKYFADDFADADKDLKDVTSDIEKNDLKGAAEERAELQAKYLELELRAIKEFRLAAAKNDIERAKKEGAEKFAPRSLAIAQKSLLDTDSYINANRHNTAMLESRSDETTAKAKHVLKITRDSKAGTKTSSEDAALKLEAVQVSGANTAANLSQKLSSKSEALAASNEANLALADEKTQLQGDQAFNASFEEARKQFTSDEAEVYKQGDTLMIRLKGLEFPPAQAVVKGSSFGLLAKVNRIIKGFDGSTVVIEGHTDSIGGKERNERLSQERADAVKEYLVSNDIVATDITTVGYGFEKPLATNKTKEGRAQNRRVDVRIQAAKADQSSSL